MLSSIDYDYRFDPFIYKTVLLYIEVLFFLIFPLQIAVNFDFNFYY